MAVYEISFLKMLVNSVGRPYTTCQGRFRIRLARSPGRALRAAEKRFARLRGVRDWRLHADRSEIKVLDAKPHAGRSPEAADERKGHIPGSRSRREPRHSVGEDVRPGSPSRSKLRAVTSSA